MSDKSTELVALLIEDMDPGAMVTKFVVIAEAIDTDGERATYTATHDGSTAWDIMGLLSYGLAREQGAITRREEGD